MRTGIAWVLMTAAVLLMPAGAIDGRWITYLDANDIQDIALTEDGIWCATGGGALFYEFSSGRYSKWNRARDELVSDSLSSVAALADGKIAFGSVAMGVSLYDPSTVLWHNYAWPLAGDVVRFIREEPPWRIVGSEGGFVASRNGVTEKTCESVDLCGLPGLDITAGVRFDDAFWLGAVPRGDEIGGVGRYRAGAGWDTLNAGLLSHEMRDFAVWNDSLFCLTAATVQAWNGTQWIARGQGLPLDAHLNRLHSGSRFLCAASGSDSGAAIGGVFEYDVAAARWTRLGSARHAKCVSESPEGTIWAGMSATGSGKTYLGAPEDGLWEWRDNTWVQHRLPGPHPVSVYRALAVDGDGSVWSVTQTGGVGSRVLRLDESGWRAFSPATGGLTNAWTFDLGFRENEVWVGHCCCLSPEGCPLDIFTPGTGAAVVVDTVMNVFDSAVDERGHRWFASWHETEESAARGIYRWDHETGEWSHYDIESTGGLLQSNRVAAIETLGSDLWIGYADFGVTRVRLNTDRKPILTEAAWTPFRADSGDIPSDQINVLTASPDGLWVGTNGGAALFASNRWRTFRASPYGLPGDVVTDICATGDGAVWMAVWGHGVTRATRNDIGVYEFQTFTVPDLVNPNPWVIAPGIGGRDVWVGTHRGLAHFVPGAAAEDDTSQAIVHIYPNPFNPECGSARFAELPGRADRGVIVNVAGDVLARFGEKWTGDAFWDGRDDSGAIVPPGLYVVRVATPRGWLSGRLAVIDLPCNGW